MNIFNENEFLEICNRFHATPRWEEVTVRYPGSSYFKQIKKAVEEDRRGEVVFCVVRPNGKCITITCKEYPEGTFRIPTGGIGHREDIVEAVLRETKEELGLDVEITDFAGVLKIRFEHDDEKVMFYSYLFILKETGGRLLLDASDDEVSEVREVTMDGLEAIVNSLKNISGQWSDWGRFRYESTNAILRYLKSRAMGWRAYENTIV